MQNITIHFICYLFIKIVDTVLITFVHPFVDAPYAAFIMSSHIITESSIELAKDSPFSQLHVARF